MQFSAVASHIHKVAQPLARYDWKAFSHENGTQAVHFCIIKVVGLVFFFPLIIIAFVAPSLVQMAFPNVNK